MRKVFAAGLLLSLAACTTARVEPEINTFAASVRSNVARITPALVPGLEAERQLALDEAARFRDEWLLSDACEGAKIAAPGVDAADCTVVKLQTDDSARSIGAATAVTRRLGALADYVDALALLANAGTEAAVINAQAAAVASLGDLASASDSGSLTEFVAGLEADKPKIDAVIGYAVRTLRYNRLKSVVVGSDDAVGEIVRNVQESMFALNLDPQFTLLAGRLTAASDATLTAGPETGDAEYRAMLVELDAAHADFMAYRERSPVVQAGLIATAHHALKGALQTQSTDDVITYLESLKTLANVLEE